MYQQATKYCGKEEKLLLSPLFHNIFNISLFLHIHSVKGGCSINCFPQFRKSDMSTYGYLEVFHRVRDNPSRLYSDRVNRVHIKLFLNEQFDPDLHSRREYIHLRVVIFF